MNSFKEDGPSYNWEHSKVESVSEYLGIDIKTLDDGVFQFCKTGFIRKVLDATGMDHFNGLPTPTKVEVPLGTDSNGSDAKRDCPNVYASVIGMMLYLESNTRPDISFAVHQGFRFTHNTKATRETAVKRICRYLQGTKDNGLVFNPSKKLVLDFYADADFSGLRGNENPQDPVCDKRRTGFVVTFSNFPLLWVSKLQTEIALSTLHSGYVSLSRSVRAVLPLKIIIKEVIDNTVYDDNNGSIVVATSPSMTPTSKHISV